MSWPLILGGVMAFAAGWITDDVIAFVVRVLRPRHPCADGHDWKHIGGRNAGCCRDCYCSVPVHECQRCGDSDYGDNAEAALKMEECGLAQEVRSCDCQGGYDQPGEVKYRSNDCPVHGEAE